MIEEQQLRRQFTEAGQGHIFRYWDELNAEEQTVLIRQAASIDLTELTSQATLLLQQNPTQTIAQNLLKPPPYIPHPENGGASKDFYQARALGEKALREGKVAAFTVAGGQGVRLGFNGPKGTFPVTPVTQKTLFNVFADKIRGASRVYNQRIPWLVMTSPSNHEATVQFFETQNYFGLHLDRVFCFPQGQMPAVDYSGKILLKNKNTIAFSPNGHGGSLEALVKSGCSKKMRECGIEIISYFQVDNPLTQCIDPAFIGFHFQNKSEMSSKMVLKKTVKEKIGVFCLQNDQLSIVEYSDLSEALQKSIEKDGQLSYRSGNIAAHLFSLDFIERIFDPNTPLALPFHRADKKIASLDNEGFVYTPDKPNGIKFERFVFDVLPLSCNPIVVEVLRAEEFSPVKNAQGQDSLQTCLEDQLRRWTNWLNKVGVFIKTDPTGLPAFTFEISADFADDLETFVKNWHSLTKKPEIKEGFVLTPDILN